MCCGMYPGIGIVLRQTLSVVSNMMLTSGQVNTSETCAPVRSSAIRNSGDSCQKTEANPTQSAEDPPRFTSGVRNRYNCSSHVFMVMLIIWSAYSECGFYVQTLQSVH
jgi:hypothetical protein